MCLSIYIVVEVFEAKKYVAYEIFFSVGVLVECV